MSCTILYKRVKLQSFNEVEASDFFIICINTQYQLARNPYFIGFWSTCLETQSFVDLRFSILKKRPLQRQPYLWIAKIAIKSRDFLWRN